jgi:hypothetical protein
LSDAVVNLAQQKAVMEDSQEEDLVQEETLLVAEVVDSFVFSLLTPLKVAKSYFVLAQEVAVATKKVEPVVVKPVEKVMVTVELVVLNPLVAQVLLVMTDLNSKEETAMVVDSKILSRMMVPAEELDTSVEKVVAMMLEAAAVAQASVTQI